MVKKSKSQRSKPEKDWRILFSGLSFDKVKEFIEFVGFIEFVQLIEVNEGKYLFDFVTSSVWNARKLMVSWLQPFCRPENEVVDLFYVITNCYGWIKSTEKEVIVRIEPLEQRSRCMAQEELCRKLTSLGAHTPTRKWLKIEVGDSPS